ncbi:MAG: hypothetical protein ACLFMQ_04565 [Desulfohalobiaceae bacterium]
MHKCPVCRRQTFYIQDPMDQFEYHIFEMTEQGPVFEEGINPEAELYPERKIFCEHCSWHGTYGQLLSS